MFWTLVLVSDLELTRTAEDEHSANSMKAGARCAVRAGWQYPSHPGEGAPPGCLATKSSTGFLCKNLPTVSLRRTLISSGGSEQEVPLSTLTF